MATTKAIRTLALSVHFRQPKFGMKNYEILSRASAFLLAVDPPDVTTTLSSSSSIHKDGSKSTYDHLLKNEMERKEKELKRKYKYEPAGGPPREIKDLKWLEFLPKDNRPVAHVVASSHVLAPWMWKEYYPQDWISQVDLEHCAYSLDVICSSQPDKSLAKFALNPYPIHHPESMDLSIIHLKNETTALRHMRDLGVEMLHLRDYENEEFKVGEKIHFEGFEIKEDNAIDNEEDDFSLGDDNNSKKKIKEDNRSFIPYNATGSLLLFSPSRYLASTPDLTSKEDPPINKPLPQGLCGGPVLDTQNRVCGVVEGIVPMEHPESQLAGAAAFIPPHTLESFVDWAECFMLQQIVPEKLFDKIQLIKEGKDLETNFDDSNLTGDIDANFSQPMEAADVKNGATDEKQNKSIEPKKKQRSNNYTTAEEDKIIQKDLENIKKEMEAKFTKEELQTIFSVVEQEKQQVMDLLKTEGGDIDDIIVRVRQRTLEKQLDLMKKMQAEHENTIVVEDEDVKDKKE